MKPTTITETPSGTTHSHVGTDRQLEQFVSDRVRGLAARYLKDQPAAVASLARLRRAVAREPGGDPMIWPDTLAEMPDALIGRGDAPSRFELAAHSAITLFAVHQQSKNQPMHRAGSGMGRAVRQLGRDFSEQATLRRFQAVATASSYAETIHHLRGIVTQLRSSGIALDYGILARDLSRLQTPWSADAVRLNWGRDYHRQPDNDTTTTESRDTTAPTTTGEQ